MLRPNFRIRRAVGATSAAAILLVLAGCAQFDAALGKQWIDVQFVSNTTIATARHVTAACSHVPNLHLEPVKQTTAYPGVVGSVRYDATNASLANMAELERCLNRFRSVRGFTQGEPGDAG